MTNFLLKFLLRNYVLFIIDIVRIYRFEFAILPSNNDLFIPFNEVKVISSLILLLKIRWSILTFLNFTIFNFILLYILLTTTSGLCHLLSSFSRDSRVKIPSQMFVYFHWLMAYQCWCWCVVIKFSIELIVFPIKFFLIFITPFSTFFSKNVWVLWTRAFCMANALPLIKCFFL